MVSGIYRPQLGHCSSSICKHWLRIHKRNGAVRRNTKKPGCKTVYLNWAKDRHLVLFLCLTVPVTVIQDSHVDTLLLQLLPLLPAYPSSERGLSHLTSVIPSIVTASCPIWIATLRKYIQTTCSLASRWSKVMASSVLISQSSASLLDRATTLAVLQVYFQCIPQGPPDPLHSLALTLALHEQKSSAFKVNAMILWLVSRQSLSPAHTVHPSQWPPVQPTSLLRESCTCYPQLGLSDQHILSIPTWGYDTSTEPQHFLNTWWICWFAESAQTVNPPGAPPILRILATM